jgi:hypothetical protein
MTQFRISAFATTLECTHTIMETAQLTLNNGQLRVARYVHSRDAIRTKIAYVGLIPRISSLIIFAAQPAPVANKYSAELPNTASSTTTGAFCISHCQL